MPSAPSGPMRFSTFPGHALVWPLARRGHRSRNRRVTANINPLAGKPAEPSMLVNVPRLVTAYFAGRPDPQVAAQRVAFGTSGHRGSALNHAFNEAHILAISQAVCD